ncbi:MAG: 50S ribosomal protein L30 [Candidatus Thermoplasmatota archaeon]|nr:50S ribosomal protein L30 [Candidatus Thermoplasmatota archaeon]MCL5730548.1 50S ribosomal protein L30 [Candidatus Thermoplasmatota archaeon]
MLAAIRIRGTTGMKPRAAKTAELLRLNRINHMVLVPEGKETEGMLMAAKDYVTWGEIDRETLIMTLRLRSLLKGRKKLEENDLKERSGAESFEQLADMILEGKLKYREIRDIVPVIRLHPPKGGYEYIRKPYGNGGSLGYRGKEINILIRKMLKPGDDLNGKNKN